MKKTFKKILMLVGFLFIIISGILGIILAKIYVLFLDSYSDEMFVSIMNNCSWSFIIIGILMIILPSIPMGKK